MERAGNATIGWIGTGVMGGAMARHLIDAGYEVRVHSRTRARSEPLIDAGARWCPTAASAADGSDFAFTMVGYPSEVREAILGKHGVLATAKPGSVVVDMTTSEPDLAREIFAAARDKDVDSLDAPVSGGDVGAKNASLTVMVGGRREAFEHALPVLEVLGKSVSLEGGPGSGQHTKMVNQIAIASGMISMCEALLYAQRAGLDVGRVVRTIEQGAAGSWSLSNYGPRILNGDFKPGFKVNHFVKDLGIALAEARKMSLSLPGLALAEQLYVATKAQGRGEQGTHALALSLAELSHLDWPVDRGGISVR